MSSGAEVVVLLPLAAPAIAAAAVGIAAVAILAHFELQYENSVREYQACLAAERAAERAKTAANTALVSATQVTAVQDANAEFLRNSLQALLDGLPESPDPTLDAKCRALQQAVAEHPEDFSTQVASYYQLAQEARQVKVNKAKTPAALSQTLSAELASVRALLNSPLLAGKECAKVRAALLHSLESYEHIAADQPGLVVQGLANLSSRIEEELAKGAKRAEVRATEANTVRDLLGAIMPQLQTVAQQAALPKYSAQAQTMLAELAQLLAAEAPGELAALQGLARRAQALFDAAHGALKAEATKGYISAQVSDILLSMGYRVSQVQEEASGERTSMIATVEQGVGLEFQVDGQGHLQTEAVSFSPEKTEVDQATQEHICSLVDQVLAHLRERQCTVRERCRRAFKPGKRLRTVKLAAAEQAVTPQAATKYLRKEE